jgi:hypothetical protein
MFSIGCNLVHFLPSSNASGIWGREELDYLLRKSLEDGIVGE